MTMSKKKTHKMSDLLTEDENREVFSALEPRQQCMSTGVIQLYTTQHPAHSHWSKRGTGIIMFVKDNAKRSYFFRFFCPNDGKITWEQEIYNNMELHFNKAYLVTFEGHDHVVAINFTSPDEAKHFYDQSQSVLVRQRNRRTRPRSSTMTAPTLPPLPGTQPAVQEENVYEEISSQVTLRNHNKPPPPMEEKSLKELFGKNRDKVRKVGGINKHEISGPANFVHVAHVGFTKENGIDSHGQADVIQGFLQKCGLLDAYNKDRQTKAFIDNFIEDHKVVDHLNHEQKAKSKRPPHPPQPPQRKHNTQTTQRRQPERGPPMPSIPAPVLSNNMRSQHEDGRNKSKSNAGPPPPPPPTAGLPPPPPPPPPPQIQNSSENGPQKSSSRPLPPVEPDNRSLLMKSIQEGTTLKKTNRAERPKPPLPINQNKSNDDNGDPSSPNDAGSEDLAKALIDAINKRYHKMKDSDSESDDENNDADWD